MRQYGFYTSISSSDFCGCILRVGVSRGSMLSFEISSVLCGSVLLVDVSRKCVFSFEASYKK